MPEPNRYTNDRGFIMYDTFLDDYGADVRVQESSSAEDPKVWIFVRGGSTASKDKANDGQAHLDVEQAERVRDALDTFLKEIPERWDR